MRRVAIIAVTALALLWVGPAAPTGAQTDTTNPPFIGETDALVLEASAVCTDENTYDVAWTLENTSDRTIDFYSAYAFAVPSGGVETPQIDVALDPLPPGTSNTVVVSYLVGFEGVYVLQTEAYFADDVRTAGPVGDVVELAGCGPLPDEGTGVGGPAETGAAPATTAKPTYTG